MSEDQQKSNDFYIDNFPTDKQTSAVVSTLISTTLTTLNLIILTHYSFYDIEYFQGLSITFTFLLVTSCANYIFFDGLLADEWKKFSSLITLKLFELVGCFGIFLSLCCDIVLWCFRWYFKFSRIIYILYPTFISLNIFYIWCIVQKFNETERVACTTTEFSEPLLSKDQQVIEKNIWLQKLKKFYIENFPTDKQTSAVLSTFISTILSAWNLIILTHYVYNIKYFPGLSITLIFLLVTSCANYIFFNGVLSDEWKKFSPLVILKLFEVVGSFGIFLSLCYDMGMFWIRWFQYPLIIYILYPTFIGLNILYTWCIVQKFKEMKRGACSNVCIKNELIESLTSIEEKNPT